MPHERKSSEREGGGRSCPVCVVAIASERAEAQLTGERRACPGCGASLRHVADGGRLRWERVADDDGHGPA
ncbi:MAG: hypothetical protein R3C15_16385 [Thermoleophilia bacterium]